jgi:hypothetical protein
MLSILQRQIEENVEEKEATDRLTPAARPRKCFVERRSAQVPMLKRLFRCANVQETFHATDGRGFVAYQQKKSSKGSYALARPQKWRTQNDLYRTMS